MNCISFQIGPIITLTIYEKKRYASLPAIHFAAASSSALREFSRGDLSRTNAAFQFCVEKYTNDMTAREKPKLKHNFGL